MLSASITFDDNDNAIVNKIADFVEKTYLKISEQYEVIESLKQRLLTSHYQTLLQRIYERKPNEILGNICRIKEMTSFKTSNVFLFKFFHHSRYTDLIFAKMPSNLKDAHGWQMREIRLHKEIIVKVLLCISSLTLHDVTRLRQDFLKDGECVDLVYGNGDHFEEKFYVLFPQKQKSWSTGYCVASSDRHGFKTIKNSPKLDGAVGFYFFEELSKQSSSTASVSSTSIVERYVDSDFSHHTDAIADESENGKSKVVEDSAAVSSSYLHSNVAERKGLEETIISAEPISDATAWSQQSTPDYITSITESDQKRWAAMEDELLREREERLREREERLRERDLRLQTERELEQLRKMVSAGTC
jgi:hypothetical protein